MMEIMEMSGSETPKSRSDHTRRRRVGNKVLVCQQRFDVERVEYIQELLIMRTRFMKAGEGMRGGDTHALQVVDRFMEGRTARQNTLLK